MARASQPLFPPSATPQQRCEALDALHASLVDGSPAEQLPAIVQALALLPTQPHNVVDAARRLVRALLGLPELASLPPTTSKPEEVVAEACRMLHAALSDDDAVDEAQQLLAVRVVRGAVRETAVAPSLELVFTPALALLERLGSVRAAAGAADRDAAARTPQATRPPSCDHSTPEKHSPSAPSSIGPTFGTRGISASYSLFHRCPWCVQVALEASAAIDELSRVLPLPLLLGSVARELALPPGGQRGATYEATAHRLAEEEALAKRMLEGSDTTAVTGGRPRLRALCRALASRTRQPSGSGGGVAEEWRGRGAVDGEEAAALREDPLAARRGASEEEGLSAAIATSVLEQLPAKLRPAPSLQDRMDQWADGANSDVPDKEVSAWQRTTLTLLELVPSLATVAATGELRDWMLPRERSGQAGMRGVVSRQRGRGTVRLGLAGASVDEEGAGARWLRACAELRSSGRSANMSRDPLASTALSEAAGNAWRALLDAACVREIEARKLLLADTLRAYHLALLEATEPFQHTHRTRRLLGALCDTVISIPRPHLSAAADSTRLVPLLLTWADTVDATARALALRALRHCIEELAAPELQWHEELLLHQLMQFTVFRETAVLEQLLPALFVAWERLHAINAASTRETQRIALLDLVCRELAYIASKPDQRRMYMRELPHLFRLLRLAVCSHLQQLIESVLHLVKVEVNTAAATAGWLAPRSPSHWKAVSASVQPVQLGLTLLHELLLAAWPRAGAHAALVTRHVLSAYMRVCAISRNAEADGGEPSAIQPTILHECVAILQLLNELGGNACLVRISELLQPRLATKPYLQQELHKLMEMMTLKPTLAHTHIAAS
ncbi:hypothetical protein AB1Y20_006700 [Prymnesium parvum]|uniref:Uncharacterized protein n=1 Tax=Prymnesium parvum TaxID=97485 RepID=A0AB34IZL7_PRYPA